MAPAPEPRAITSIGMGPIAGPRSVLAILLAGMSSASADIVLPVGYYNMLNGAGTGAKGDYQYWDGTYSGAEIGFGDIACWDEFGVRRYRPPGRLLQHAQWRRHRSQGRLPVLGWDL